MFARLFAVASLAALAVASPTLSVRGSAECNTGSVNCCNNTYQASDASSLLETFGLVGVLGDVTGLIGLGCTSVVGSSSCQQQPICCNNNSFNGLVNVGCSPINVNA